MKRSTIFILLTLIILGIYATWLYLQMVAPACVGYCADVYRGVLTGTADSPYRYRIISFALVYLIGGNPQTETAIILAYVIAHGIVFPLTFIAYYKGLRRWLSPLTALLGVVLLVMYLPVMFHVYGTALYSPTELALLALALWWMRPGWRYALLIVVATLNRETGLLLVLAFAAVYFPRRRERRIQLWLAVYVAIWLSIYVGLRLWRGAAPDVVTVAEAWAGNTSSWRTVEAVMYNLFFVPLFVSVFLAWKHLSDEMRRLLIGVGLPYVFLAGVFGYWSEVRLWIPMMPFFTVALVTVIDRLYSTPRQSSASVSQQPH